MQIYNKKQLFRLNRGPATSDDHNNDLYKISPENDHGRDGHLLTKILANLKK